MGGGGGCSYAPGATTPTSKGGSGDASSTSYVVVDLYPVRGHYLTHLHSAFNFSVGCHLSTSADALLQILFKPVLWACSDIRVAWHDLASLHALPGICKRWELPWSATKGTCLCGTVGPGVHDLFRSVTSVRHDCVTEP